MLISCIYQDNDIKNKDGKEYKGNFTLHVNMHFSVQLQKQKTNPNEPWKKSCIIIVQAADIFLQNASKYLKYFLQQAFQKAHIDSLQAEVYTAHSELCRKIFYLNKAHKRSHTKFFLNAWTEKMQKREYSESKNQDDYLECMRRLRSQYIKVLAKHYATKALYEGKLS